MLDKLKQIWKKYDMAIVWFFMLVACIGILVSGACVAYKVCINRGLYEHIQ